MHKEQMQRGQIRKTLAYIPVQGRQYVELECFET